MKKLLIIFLICSLLSVNAEAVTFDIDTPPVECEIPDGAVGVWQIPSFHISIPVYSTLDRSQWQRIVDEEDSALLYPWAYARRIADHAFSRSSTSDAIWFMKHIEPGTSGYLVTSDGIAQYRSYLTAVVDCDPWGYSINGKTILPYSSTDIATVCCVGDDSTRNYIALFKYIGGYESD